ncbi:hypothetical protein [Leptospira stimsonii]|uniref:Uncharacterized protein n=1 Tax=Leptospira stimsonii TaxID=2202203 RepID=A0ABY2N546_9LEPT|nr:hypothetical protein [Leptospira stimsonii]TGK26946.1 hypothetical protein EHO98_00015 [Leptospira stimsonii]TGM16906.1 hypothetical protein EHQ90_08370 [Leptospira stimsonii]
MKNGKGSKIIRKQKELLKLQRELNVIRKKIHALPLLPLPKPVFHSYAIGWEIKLTTSKYIDQYKYIVEVYAIHSKTKTLKKAKELNPPKITLSNREYLKLLEKYPMALRWFIKGKNKLNKKIYIFNKQDILIKRIFKIYATHLRTIDPNLESRKAEIENTIYENYKNSALLNKYLGLKSHWREDIRHKYEIRYLETITKEELNTYR